MGDHAVDHLKYNAPLTSDIIGVASPMSDWVRTSKSPSDLATAGAEAIAISQSYPGSICTVIAPGDHAWGSNAVIAPQIKVSTPKTISDKDISDAAQKLLGAEYPALFLGSRALRKDALHHAGRIAAKSMHGSYVKRFPQDCRGEGVVPIERLPYFAESAVEFLKGLTHMTFIGAPPPVAFFAYPDKPGWLSPEVAELLELASPDIDAEDTLKRLADAMDAPNTPEKIQTKEIFGYEEGELNRENAAMITANLLPENAIVSDESGTSGSSFFRYTASASFHD